MAEATTFHSEYGLEGAFWRNVAIVDIAVEVDVEKMVKLGDGYRMLRTAHPRGIVVLVFMREGLPPSTAEARAESVRFTKELGDSLLGLVMVVEDRGVLAQVMRSALRGFSLLARGSKTVVVATVDAGIEAVVPRVPRVRPGDDCTEELRGAIASVRRRTRVPALRGSKGSALSR
jgi:hypothetical protein